MPFSIIYKFIFGIVLLFGNSYIFAQESVPIEQEWYAAANMKVHLNGWDENGTSHFTLGLSAGTAFRKEEIPFALLLQSGVNFYAKGLGTNILDNYITESGKEERRKFQFDWVTALLGVLEWGPQIRETDRSWMPIVHFNQMTAYSLRPYYHYTLHYGTQFVVNSQNKHQQVATIGFQSPWAALSIYNDGTLGRLVGDDYDRFWTGGGHLRLMAYHLHNEDTEWNRISLNYHYDRYTYDVQDGYRLSNLLLIPNADNQDFYKLLFNNAMTTFSLNYENYNLGISIMGRSGLDIQDLIHKTLGYPKHLTYAPNEILLSLGGFSFHNIQP